MDIGRLKEIIALMREEGVEYLKLEGELVLARRATPQLPDHLAKPVEPERPKQAPPEQNEEPDKPTRRHPLLQSHRRELGLE